LKDGSRRFKYKIRRRLPDGRMLTRVQQFRTDKAGKRWARRLEAQLDDGKFVDSRPGEQRTMAELFARYRAEVVPGYSERERRTRETKLAWWEKRLGAIRLVALRRAHLLEGLVALENGVGTPSGRPLSPPTRRRYIAAIQHVLTQAIRWEWLETSPAFKLARPGKDKESPGRIRYLSDDERERLLAACEAQRERRLAPLVQLAILTGCRQGELLSLRWGDIDWRRRQLALVGDDGTRRTKNREGRGVPLTASAIEVLRRLRQCQVGESELVFANRRGKAPFPRQAFLQAVLEAGIENFRFHDLRHTFASYLLMSGASLAELAEALGHKTLAMVKRYSHISRSHAATVVDRMEARLKSGGFG